MCILDDVGDIEEEVAVLAGICFCWFECEALDAGNVDDWDDNGTDDNKVLIFCNGVSSAQAFLFDKVWKT